MSSSSGSRKRPQKVQGIPVHRWVGIQQAAQLVGRSDRTLQRWRDRGLPFRGSGQNLRFPVPHLIIWTRQFLRAMEQPGSGGPDRLPFSTALVAQQAEVAAWELQARVAGTWLE